MTLTTADRQMDSRGRVVWQRRAAWEGVSMRKPFRADLSHATGAERRQDEPGGASEHGRSSVTTCQRRLRVSCHS